MLVKAVSKPLDACSSIPSNMFNFCPKPDYWSESDQDEVDGSMTLKQEGPSSLCDTYHRTPSVSQQPTPTNPTSSLLCFVLMEYFIHMCMAVFSSTETTAPSINKTSECESIWFSQRHRSSVFRCLLSFALKPLGGGSCHCLLHLRRKNTEIHFCFRCL